jgi:hypothetical protein
MRRITGSFACTLANLERVSRWPSLAVIPFSFAGIPLRSRDLIQTQIRGRRRRTLTVEQGGPALAVIVSSPYEIDPTTESGKPLVTRSELIEELSLAVGASLSRVNLQPALKNAIDGPSSNPAQRVVIPRGRMARWGAQPCSQQLWPYRKPSRRG